MALAFGALEPLTLAAAASNSAVLVAAAGVVVVLAILLVFVMVLRGNSSTRQQRGSGLDYDAQRGPIGQPQAPAGGPDAARSRGGASGQPWPASGMEEPYGAQDQGYDQGSIKALDRGACLRQPGQGQAWGAPFAEQDAGAHQNAPWGAQSAPDPWNEPAPAVGRSAAAADAWGAPQAPGAQKSAAPWETPATAPGRRGRRVRLGRSRGDGWPVGRPGRLRRATGAASQPARCQVAGALLRLRRPRPVRLRGGARATARAQSARMGRATGQPEQLLRAPDSATGQSSPLGRSARFAQPGWMGRATDDSATATQPARMGRSARAAGGDAFDANGRWTRRYARRARAG